MILIPINYKAGIQIFFLFLTDEKIGGLQLIVLRKVYTVDKLNK